MRRISPGNNANPRPTGTALLLLAFVAFAPTRGPAAQEVDSAGRPAPQSGFKITKIVPPQAGLGDIIELQVEGFPQWIAANKVDPNTIALFIDSKSIKGLPVQVHEGRIRVRLATTKESQDVWDDLLDRPTFAREVEIGIGRAEGEPVASTSLELVIIPRRLFAISLFIVAAAFGVFVWLAMTTSIIRDPNTAVTDPKLKTYSLGKFQMAVWYFLVLAAFLFIWTIKGSPPTISDQVLGLIGIASGTALAATAIDISKTKSAQASLATSMRTQAELSSEIQRLAPQMAAATAGGVANDANQGDAAAREIASKAALLEQSQQSAATAQRALTPSVSTSFIDDLLTDADGISFHRFQILIWTLTLGFVFGVGVWRELKMPAFDSSLLTLMGISSATYLGFSTQKNRFDADEAGSIVEASGKLRRRGRSRAISMEVATGSVLLVTLDSRRYDTFAEVEAPDLRSIGTLYRAMAPATFTYAFHAA
jgi:hypothetical protein